MKAGWRSAQLAPGQSITVILPTAVGGIVTATIVAVARAAGETAPLLFTSSIFANVVTTDVHQAMASMPTDDIRRLRVTQRRRSAQAWAAALVLMAVVLSAASSGALLSLRTRRQIEQEVSTHDRIATRPHGNQTRCTP